MANKHHECDVLVVGGGPSGSTISTLLAEKGWRVTLLEKEQFPRFHIGESLLPLNLPILDRLGVREQVSNIGIQKFGAEFNSDQHKKPITYYFGSAFDESLPYAYEVKRSEFDSILLDNCRTKNVDVHESTKVVAIDFSDSENITVTTRTNKQENEYWRTRFIVDASGRDTFLAKKMDLQKPNPRHASAALFAHFNGVERRPNKDEGNISIYWFDHGWFWLIPFKGKQVSVGAVCWPYYLKSRKKPVEEFLWDTINLCPPLKARMRNAEIVGTATATGNYSYSAKRMTGNRYLMVGDAYAFVDPVFSSGVLLAMSGAVLASDVVDTALKHPDNSRLVIKKARQYEKTVKYGIKTFSWFIFRITQPAMRNMFMAPKPFFGIKKGIISLLAGDLFRKTPIRTPLLIFKVLYYISFLLDWKNNIIAARKRRRSLHNSDKS